jgi:endo-1,4-beta-xylanase
MFRYFTRKNRFVIILPLVLVFLIGSLFFLPRGTEAHKALSPTLGAAAALNHRTFGTAVSPNLLSDPGYANLLSTEFTGVTPENAMKWDATEPTRGSFNFTDADTLVNYAQDHHMMIRGHVLVWHSQLASWVSQITDPADLLSAMKAHIAGVAGHFKGKVSYWDVVNEAFNEDGTRRATIFQNLLGDSYIETAFRAAHATDPRAKLCYNDYNIDGINAKSDAVYAMVKDFKARGVPISCVGLQAHLILGQLPSDIQANMQRFVDLGVDVQVTELDIRMNMPATPAKLVQQAEDFANVVSACMSVARCNDITTWEIDDGHSWVPSVFTNQGAPLLFDASYQKKPAYYSTLQTLRWWHKLLIPTATPTPATAA